MSSYFDAWDQEVSAIADEDDNAVFLTKLAEIERPHVKRMSLVVGDREFPADLREKAMTIIAQWAIGGVSEDVLPTAKAKEWVAMMRSSEISTRLHSLFHELGSRRIKTRFGVMLDSPSHILVLRDEHDGTNVADMVPVAPTPE